MRNRTIHTLPSLDDIENMMRDYYGLCTNCGAAHDATEPDAEYDRCDECGENARMGPHWYLFTENYLEA